MANGSTVVDLCDDSDDSSSAKVSSARTTSSQSAIKQPRDSASKSEVVSLLGDERPDRTGSTKERTSKSQSSQTSDTASRASEKRKPHSSTSKSLNHRQKHSEGLEHRPGSRIVQHKAGDSGLGSMKNQKRPRESEGPSSESGHPPEKRQRSLQVPGQGLQSRAESKTSGKSIGANEDNFVDLTLDDGPGTQVAQNGKGTGAKATDHEISRAFNGSSSPSRRTNVETSSRALGARHDHGKSSGATSSPLRELPSRKRSPRPIKFSRAGNNITRGDEQGPEIPESLPGSPENEVPSGRSTRDRGSPSNAASAALGRLSQRSSPGLAPKRNPRPLPLTPSESSADEGSRGKDRQTERPDAIHVPGVVGPKQTMQAASPSSTTLGAVDQGHKSGGPAQQSSATKPSVVHRLSTSEQIESIAAHRLNELRRDHEHWTRSMLQRARSSVENRPPASPDEPTSVFSKIKPIAVRFSDDKKTGGDKNCARFETEIFRSGKKSVWSLPCSTFNTEDEDVPAYSYFVKLKHNVLAPNEVTMQHWPYFDDDINSNPILNEQFGSLFHLDLADRESKLSQMLKAESYANCAEQMLEDMHCTWPDVLHYLLDPNPNVGHGAEAERILRARHTFCDAEPYRNSKRWAALLSRLPTAVPERTASVGLLCERFYKLTRLSFWHIARRCDYAKSHLEEKPKAHSEDELTCRVCLRFSCPYHGQIENPDDDQESDADSQHSDEVAKDIINPPKVNYRSWVGLPPSVDDDAGATAAGSSKDRRALHYWQSGSNANLQFIPDKRDPFYPCHHPGELCSVAECSCFTNKIPCEKSCACSATCSRKFQGCNCTSKKGRVCFENTNCACFQQGRECDPDLCGECGVCDVLDPQHRHDDRVLINRCNNANIQRGVPKHTITGKSAFHGFGLYAGENIREHDFIGEYKGEIITTKEADRRGAVYEHQKLSYLFTLNQSQEVDSTFFGNKMRFINHATKAKCNVYARIITVNTGHRIGLYAERNIRAGEELAFDYGPRFTFADDGKKQGKGEKWRDQAQSNSKAVPHVRNANITKSFWDPDQDGDRHGGRAAQKSHGRPPTANQPGRAENHLRRVLSSSSNADADVDMGEPDDDDDEDFVEEENDDEDLYGL